MIKKTSSISHVEETVNIKWSVSKVPQYISRQNACIYSASIRGNC